MSADDLMRNAFANVPVPEFETTAFTRPRPLAEAKVAIVTTAGLAHPGEPWQDQSSEFRTFERHDRGVVMAHNSMNLDRAGFAADRNVAYPIDRLEEMASEGLLGDVAPRHISFLGSTFELSTMRLDTGPRAAKLLREDGVDVVLLTPV
jgi:D-proline reductase (dithiol) PrdB